MKKFVTVFGVLVALLLFGCAGSPTIYDPSVPLEQSSTLRVVDCFVYKLKDGSTTDNSENRLITWGRGMGLGQEQVIIPAGIHTLAIQDGNNRYAIMTYRFLPGYTYQIAVGKFDRAFIINETNLDSDFIPDPTSVDATPYEGEWVSTDSKYKVIFCDNRFLFFANGKYDSQGIFSYSRNNLEMVQLARFSGGKWKVSVGSVMPSFSEAMMLMVSYNGTTINMGRFEFRKVE